MESVHATARAPTGGCVHCSPCELVVQVPDSSLGGEAPHDGAGGRAYSCVCKAHTRVFGRIKVGGGSLDSTF